MTSRRILFLFALPGLLFPIVAAAAAKQLYTCGMHPEVIRSEPGNCPICGMKLTPIPEDAAGGGVLQIAIDPETIQRMNLKTAPVIAGPVRREVRAVGAVAFDERGRRDITTKYEGWLEKLYVDASWTAVAAGDPLFEIYSPDLYNAQVNFLVARRAEGESPGPLTRSASERMRLFDLPDSFVSELAARGKAQRTFTFRAPSAGVVIEKVGIQGQMMRPGEVIYRLADLSTVWVLAQIYESDLPLVRVGQKADVRITFGPERSLTGEVALVLPEVTASTRTAVARIVVPNPDGFLRPGMYADVRFTTLLHDDAVLVPDTAVLRTGEHNTVFVAREGGRFAPREVVLGLRTDDDQYEILSGLKAGERVVVSGQFMLDSESQRREAIQKMLRAESSEGGAGAPPAAAEASQPPAAIVGYVCPMHEHTPTPLPEPGKCPVCGMTLEPVYADAPAGHAR